MGITSGAAIARVDLLPHRINQPFRSASLCMPLNRRSASKPRASIILSSPIRRRNSFTTALSVRPCAGAITLMSSTKELAD